MTFQIDAYNPVKLNAIEINITEMCNLCCKGCDHSIGIIQKRHIPKTEIIYDIEAAAKVLHARTIRVLGGEPLLHPNLLSILRHIKASYIADSIELWTNGILLKEIPEFIFDFIDGVIISKYPQVEWVWDVALLQKYSNRYKIWFYIRDCKRFKWSNRTNKIEDISLVKILHKTCQESMSCHTIRNGKFYKCVQAAYSCDRLLASGIRINDDGINLHSNCENSKRKILNHIWSHTPITACYYCLGEFGDSFLHQNLQHKYKDATKSKIERFDPFFIIPS